MGNKKRRWVVAAVALVQVMAGACVLAQEEPKPQPETPPAQAAPQTNDLFVDAEGLIWLTDRVGGGLYVLEADPVILSDQ